MFNIVFDDALIKEADVLPLDFFAKIALDLVVIYAFFGKKSLAGESSDCD